MAISDRATVITTVDSDFFDAIETTTVCQPGVSFADSRQRAAHWWSGGLDQLRFLLDVRAAHHHVRPLPTVKMDGDTRVVDVIRDADWSPSARTPARTDPRTRAGHLPSETPPRIQRWERSLLDMSYANPLLRRKKASSIGIHIPSGALGLLEDKVADGSSLRLVAHDEIEQIHQAQGARIAADIEPETIRSILQQEDRLFVALPEREYQRRLKSLARRSKTAVEETGSDNLYLTLGTLEWQDGGRAGAAPLFLVPVKLVGGRGVVPFSVEIDESRERVPNYCLIEKLKVSYGLDIPELEFPEEDESGIDITAALGAIRTAILRARNTVGLQVEEDAYLALLQFSTLDMWQDLRKNWRQFGTRPSVRHLVESPGSVFFDGIDLPEPTAQDEARNYLPIPADGSQIDAVRSAAAGKTFILEGPPGTGKSQTITNLIAHSMALGKKVLFVAEKPAALEVVRRRLDNIGLGVFSLDVHGRTQSVAAVRDQLRAALEEPAEPEPGWDALQSSYAAVTESLARYPAQLHQPGPVGLSAWDARQLILEQGELGADAATAITVPRSAVAGEVELTDLYNTAQNLSSAVLDLGGHPGESAWRLSGGVDPEQLDHERIASCVAELATAERNLDGPARELSDQLIDRAHFDVLADWFDTADRGLAWPTGDAAKLVDAQWTDAVARCRNAIAKFRAEQDRQLGPFIPAALELDVDRMLARSQEIDRHVFGKKKRRAEVMVELPPVLRGELQHAHLTAALQNLIAVRAAVDRLRREIAALPMINPRPGWTVFDDQDIAWFEAAITGLEVADRLRRTVAALPEGTGPGLQRLDSSTEALLRAGSGAATHAGDALRRYGQAWEQFCDAVGAKPETIGGWLAGRSRGVAVQAALPHWQQDTAGGSCVGLQRWVRFRSYLAEFMRHGIDDLVRRTLEGDLSAADIEPQLRIGVAKAVLDERLTTSGLVGFDEAERARQTEQFGRRGADVRDRMPNELRSRVIAARSFDPNARVGEVSQLRSELRRRRGGRSVRRLLHDFDSLITEITPCLLMSPHSVARFLPPTADFDIVVFDEASQIRVPESIGALGRGKAAVIVGDSKQMPPTSMFAAAGEDAEEEGAEGSVLVPADLESILSEAVESQLPRKLLSWHYRSRDESLIAFSNLRYYDGRLATFPAPPSSDGNTAVELRQVQGVWEGGNTRAARVNREEASRVVEEIRQLSHQDEASLGVVTFNSQQRDLVLDLLESDEDPRIQEQMQQETEPLFVKNLENVQGDERDVILFSLAFSEDEKGRVPLNWGPLTRTGGERRLNVAITRAKERVMLFASFDPRRLDLGNSSSQGLRDLKDYLLQAAGRTATTAVANKRDTTDKHLEDVAVTLRAAGLEVRENVGLSDFVVDLAVAEPASDTWIAVLLDGPGWADRASVGDRETLPPAVLKDMGWPHVERIWMPTWLRDRESVVASVKAAVSNAATSDQRKNPADSTPATEDDVAAAVTPSMTLAAGPDYAPAERAPEFPTAASAGRQPAVRGIGLADATTHGSDGVTGQPQDDAPSRLPVYSPAEQRVSYEAATLDAGTAQSTAAIHHEIEQLIDAEAPILSGRLVQLLAARFDVSRVRESRRKQLLQYIGEHGPQTAANGDVVVWPKNVQPSAYREFRVPESGTKRDVQTIPYEELRNAMVHVTRSAHGADVENLLRETARLFGVTRLASQVRPRLEGVLSAACQEGWLLVREGAVSVGLGGSASS